MRKLLVAAVVLFLAGSLPVARAADNAGDNLAATGAVAGNQPEIAADIVNGSVEAISGDGMSEAGSSITLLGDDSQTLTITVRPATLIFGRDSKEMSFGAIKVGDRVTVSYSRNAQGAVMASIIQVAG